MNEVPAVIYTDAQLNDSACRLFAYGVFSAGWRLQDVLGTLLLLPLYALLLSLFKHQSSPLGRAARISLIWPLGAFGIRMLFGTLMRVFDQTESPFVFHNESLEIAYNGVRWVFSFALSAMLATLLVQGISAARKEKQSWIRAAIALFFLVLVWLVWLVPEVWAYFNCS
jgi:hypothetical protein